MTLKVLLVGAGAVGLSYGYYLARAGCDVAFLVKPKYADELAAGTTLYFPQKRDVREPVAFPCGEGGYRVLTTNEAVAAEAWDYVLLCISVTALRGPWLVPFLASLSAGRPTLVVLTPGADDFNYLAERYPHDRIATGVITLVAWQTPLPGEPPHPPGIAVWFPPLTKLPFWGPKDQTDPLVAALKRGGAGAKSAGTIIRPGGPAASGILTTHVAALEAVGWTFKGLSQSPLRKLAAQAARQAVAVIAVHKGNRPPLYRGLIRAWPLGLGLKIAAWRVPFPFETYLRHHFTKVRDQTAFTLGELVQLGRAQGRDVDAIADLKKQVFG